MGTLCSQTSNDDSNGKQPDPSRSLTIIHRAETKSNITIGNCQVFLCLGDLFEEEAIAIVHPSDEGLKNNLEFSLGLLARAGPRVRQEIEDYKEAYPEKIRIGHIFMTSAGDLKAKFLIHFVTSKFVTGEMGEEKHLEQTIHALYNSLHIVLTFPNAFWWISSKIG